MALSREDRWRSTAQRYADDRGRSATLRARTSTFDTSTGTTTDSTSDTSINISPPRSFSPERIDGTLIQDGDIATSIPAEQLSDAPSEATDTLVFDGDEWQIVRVEPRWAGTKVTTYTVQLRK